MTGGVEAVERGCVVGVVVADEYPVVAVTLGWAERFTHDRQDPGVLLSGRFGNQLLDPVAERPPCVDRQLVAPDAHARAEHGRERGARAVVGAAALDHLDRAAQDRRRGRWPRIVRGQHAEVRERAVAPADVGLVS